MKWKGRLVLVAALFCSSLAHGERLRPGQTLGQTDTMADFVFKGIVVSSTAAGTPQIHYNSDLFFGSGDTFVEKLTRFKIVSVIKGDKSEDEITFRHYEDATPQEKREGLLQVAYHFEPGHAYLVFAASSGTAGFYKQVGTGFGFKADYGVVRCANAQPVSAKTIQEIAWVELTAMLHDKDAGDIQYAMVQFDQLSGGLHFAADYRYGVDFQPQGVLKLINPFLKSPDPHVAQAAAALIDRLTAHARNLDQYRR